MSESNDYAEKRRKLKQDFLSRAINEGRGPEAIRKLNALYNNVRETWRQSHDEIVGELSARLTGGEARTTYKQFEEAGGIGVSRNLRALNTLEALRGRTARYCESSFFSGPPTLQ